MSEKITARLQTPKDSDGNRKDVHLVTTSNEVIVHPDSESPETLESYLGKIVPTEESDPVIISSEQPTVTRSTMWIKPRT